MYQIQTEHQHARVFSCTCITPDTPDAPDAPAAPVTCWFPITGSLDEKVTNQIRLQYDHLLMQSIQLAA